MRPHSPSRELAPTEWSEARGPLEWSWPSCPSHFVVHDKYARVDQTLRLTETEWSVPVQGKRETFRFAAEGAGLLQRKLVTLTQADHSPSSIVKFTRSLIKRWDTYVELLEQGPGRVRELWDDTVLDVDTAKAGKKLLKLVCHHGLGPWTPGHLYQVRSLDTRAKQGLLAQHAKVKRREKVLPVSTQAEVVHVLDTAALEAQVLPEEQVEGLAALALVFQFGMRPVQMLSLGLEHVSEPQVDAAGAPTLVISFHRAKKVGASLPDLHRAVKPEWVSLLNQLRRQALHHGRDRLFSCTSADAIWGKVRQACRAKGLRVNFKAYGLRHTSIQALADAGHDRKSIQAFAGHNTINAASTYLRATRSQATLINKALGVSKLYENLETLSKDSFITMKQLMDEDEDKQIGGIVGSTLVSGIGLCASGQSNCPYNPVSSCYGCGKFMPVAKREPHVAAIAGLREQVLVFVPQGDAEAGPALTQLCNALSGAQQALAVAQQMLEKRGE